MDLHCVHRPTSEIEVHVYLIPRFINNKPIKPRLSITYFKYIFHSMWHSYFFLYLNYIYLIVSKVTIIGTSIINFLYRMRQHVVFQSD